MILDAMPSNEKRKMVARQGTASVELILALVVVLPLMGLLIHQAYFYIAFLKSTKECRYKAFSQRREHVPADSFDFNFSDLNKRKERTVGGPVLGKTPKPGSTSSVLANSWDYDCLPLERPNHLESGDQLLRRFGSEILDPSQFSAQLEKILSSLDFQSLASLSSMVDIKNFSGDIGSKLTKLRDDLKKSLSNIVDDLASGKILDAIEKVKQEAQRDLLKSILKVATE